jgi:hypothetical protein
VAFFNSTRQGRQINHAQESVFTEKDVYTMAKYQKEVLTSQDNREQAAFPEQRQPNSAITACEIPLYPPKHHQHNAVIRE